MHKLGLQHPSLSLGFHPAVQSVSHLYLQMQELSTIAFFSTLHWQRSRAIRLLASSCLFPERGNLGVHFHAQCTSPGRPETQAKLDERPTEGGVQQNKKVGSAQAGLAFGDQPPWAASSLSQESTSIPGGSKLETYRMDVGTDPQLHMPVGLEYPSKCLPGLWYPKDPGCQRMESP